MTKFNPNKMIKYDRDEVYQSHLPKLKPNTEVKYIGCSIEQIQWGSNDDPREVLEKGKVYLLEDREVHSWHTKYKLQGIDGWFNSACFDSGDPYNL